MTVKLNTFYEKLESQNAKRHKIYKKLVRIAEKKFPALQESVGKAYVEDNKTSIYNLNLLKNKIEMAGGSSTSNDLLASTQVNTHQENYNELVGNVIEQVKTGMLGGTLNTDFYKELTSPEYRLKEIDTILAANNFKTDEEIIKYFEDNTNPYIAKYCKVVQAITKSKQAQSSLKASTNSFTKEDLTFWKSWKKPTFGNTSFGESAELIKANSVLDPKVAIDFPKLPPPPLPSTVSPVASLSPETDILTIETSKLNAISAFNNSINNNIFKDIETDLEKKNKTGWSDILTQLNIQITNLKIIINSINKLALLHEIDSFNTYASSPPPTTTPPTTTPPINIADKDKDKAIQKIFHDITDYLDKTYFDNFNTSNLPLPQMLLTFIQEQLKLDSNYIDGLKNPANFPNLINRLNTFTGNDVKRQLDILIELLKNKLKDNQRLKPEETQNIYTLVDTLQKLSTLNNLNMDEIQKLIGAEENTLGTKLAQSKNKMNILIAGFFSQFAENMPKWLLVQEYSKSFEDFQKLAQIMKKERVMMAADTQAELRVAIAMAKLGALFSLPPPPTMVNNPFNPRNREEKFAASAAAPSGLIIPYYEQMTGGAEQEKEKPGEDKEKQAEKKAKEETEAINNAKKDANELSQFLSQIQSEYKKSYAFEADSSNDPNFKDDKDYLENKQNELKRMLTNGELSSDERSLVTKWASIKEEQKWIDGLKSKIDKAKELYDKVQKSITKLASVPNDPELAEMLRILGLYNDGNMDAKDADGIINYEKFSVPNNISNILTEITSAYRLVTKAYGDAGESVTKRQNQPTSSSSSNTSRSDAAKQLNNDLEKLKLKVNNYLNIVNKNIDSVKSDNKKFDLYDGYDEATYDNDVDTKSKLSDILGKISGVRIPDNDNTQGQGVYNKNREDISNITNDLDKIESPIPIKYKLQSNDTKKDIKNSISNHIEKVKTIIDNNIIRQMLKPLEMRSKTRMSPEFGALNENPTLLDDIYNRYQKSKTVDGNLLSAINLENMLNANNLIPSEVLKINSVDKMIFAFVIIMFRLISVTLTEYMISKGWISSFANGIISIGVIYTVIFVLFVLIVNFDLWRLRVLFNYVNLHVNTMVIVTHLAMVWGLFGVVLLLVYNINFNMTGLSTSISSEEDIAKLEYRLEMVTALLWVIILLMVAIF